MACIICDWCQYVGQGSDYAAILEDVLMHEQECPEKQDLIDEATLMTEPEDLE